MPIHPSPHRNRALLAGLLFTAYWGVVVVAQQDPAPSDPPLITITTLDGTATEQNAFVDAIPDTAEFRVHRTAALDEPLVVFYRVEGTATNGKDYVPLEGELLIPAGQDEAALIVFPLDDDEFEPIETVTVSLLLKETAPGEIGPGYYEVGQPESATAVLVDDEASANLAPTVVLVSPPPDAILPIAPEIDLLAEARDLDGWVTAVEFFADGNSIGVAEAVPRSPEAALPLLVRALNDPDWLAPHLFRVAWHEATAGPHLLFAVAEDNLGEKSESEAIQVQLVDLPEPTVVTVQATDAEAGEGLLDDTFAAIPDPARFTLVRSGPLDIPLEVFFQVSGTAINGVDYSKVPASAVIPEGANSVDLVINPIDDLVAEPTETIVVTLVPPLCIGIYPPPPECYLVGVPASAKVLLRDNEHGSNTPPHVRLVYPNNGQLLRWPTDLQLTAAAWDADGSIVSVEFFAGVRSLGVVTVPSLLPVGQAFPENADGVIPRFSLAWKDVPPGHYSLTAQATDDDAATTTSFPVEVWVTDAGDLQIVTVEATDADAAEPSDSTPGAPDTGTFTLQRSGSINGALTVYFRLGGTARNGIDYQELPSQIVIPAGAKSVEVDVWPLSDGITEGVEHVVLNLLPPVRPPGTDDTGLPAYEVGGATSARIAIRDIDAPLNLSPGIRLRRPNDGQVFLDAQEIELLAVAQDPDGWVPTVEFYDGDALIGTSKITFIREPEPGLPQSFSFNWKNVTPGQHELKARAQDDQGAWTTSTPVLIAVQSYPSGEFPPDAEITRPFPSAVYHVPAIIPVATQTRDRDGYVTRVEWFANGRKIGEQIRKFRAPPSPGLLQVFRFLWRDAPPGEYSLTSQATDDQGLISASSEPVPVTVLATDEPPVVTLFVADPLASEQLDAEGNPNGATFKIRRSGPLDQPLTVFYELRGSASNGVDYATLPGYIAIPSGSRWTTLTMTPLPDELIEGAETIIVALTPSPAMSIRESYVIGSHRVGVGLIFDSGEQPQTTPRIRRWLHLRLKGEAGVAYRLEVSNDLKQWQAVTEERADDSGVNYVEILPHSCPQRFYRLRRLAPEAMQTPKAFDDEW